MTPRWFFSINGRAASNPYLHLKWCRQHQPGPGICVYQNLFQMEQATRGVLRKGILLVRPILALSAATPQEDPVLAQARSGQVDLEHLMSSSQPLELHLSVVAEPELPAALNQRGFDCVVSMRAPIRWHTISLCWRTTARMLGHRPSSTTARCRTYRHRKLHYGGPAPRSKTATRCALATP